MELKSIKTEPAEMNLTFGSTEEEDQQEAHNYDKVVQSSVDKQTLKKLPSPKAKGRKVTTPIKVTNKLRRISGQQPLADKVTGRKSSQLKSIKAKVRVSPVKNVSPARQVSL